jgi:hypothetical protein
MNKVAVVQVFLQVVYVCSAIHSSINASFPPFNASEVRNSTD